MGGVTFTDWEVFQLAAIEFLNYRNPYGISWTRGAFQVALYHPWWTLLPLIPFAILPGSLGYHFMQLGWLGSLVAAGRRWGWGKLGTAAAAISTFSLATIMEGQIEWLIIVGILLGGPYGYLLLATKPIGWGFLVWDTWKTGLNWKRQFMNYSLLVPAVMVQLIIYGWPSWISLVDKGWNAAKYWWPASLVIAVGLIIKGLLQDDKVAFGSSVAWMVPYLDYRSIQWGFFGLGRWGVMVGSALSWLIALLSMN